MANEIYNTSWWGNAIDTAITAGTEPDFFGSQMKILTGQQPELVTNGDFATDSGWSKQTGWTIANGKANSAGSTGAVYQSKTYVSSKNYKVTYTISDYVSGSLRITWGNAAGVSNNGNGTFTEIISPTSGGNVMYMAAVGTFTGSIDNVSVKLARAEEVEAVKCLADWIHTTALQDLNN